MRRRYTKPDFVVHGNVYQITAASADSDREDRIFNAAGIHSTSGIGSLDQCYADKKTHVCVVPK